MRTITYDETKWQLVPLTPMYKSRLAAVPALQELARLCTDANRPHYRMYRGETLVWDSQPVATVNMQPALSDKAAEELATRIYRCMVEAAPTDHRNEEQIGVGEPLEHTCPHQDWFPLTINSVLQDGRLLHAYALTENDQLELSVLLSAGERGMTKS